MKKSAAKTRSATARRQVAKTAHPMEGKPAPAFELPNVEGFPVKLGELLGQGPLILYFYPKDMTSGCTQEACDFRDRLTQIHAQGWQVIGISPDSPQSHRKFQAKYDLNFPLLSDADKKVVKAYGVYKKKSLYGREFMGVERTTFLIDSSGIIRTVFPKVRVAGHAEATLKMLDELGTP